jgi:hypothetical protein
VWLVADDAELTMGEIAASALIGAAIGLVVAVIALVLAMSRFRTLFSRMGTPSVLLLGGLGFWAWLLLEPRALIGLVVGLSATRVFPDRAGLGVRSVAYPTERAAKALVHLSGADEIEPGPPYPSFGQRPPTPSYRAV